MKWPSLIWHIPGNIWKAMIASSPVTVWMRFWVTLSVLALTTAMLLIIWKGPWPEVAWSKRLDWLGWGFIVTLLIILVCVVALYDFKLKFNATKEGLTADMDGQDDGRPLTQTTTTTTTATS